jgi:hypothetical protein
MPIPTPYATISATDALAKLPKRPAYATELQEMLAGDLWRNSQAWIGDLPTDRDALAAMARGIVSENVLAEILFRAVAAVLGKEPRWRLTPREGERPADDTPEGQAITAIEQALTSWWDTRDIVSVLRAACTWRAGDGRGPLYALIPPGLRDDEGAIPRCETLADALEYLYVDARSPADAGVAIDTKTRLPLGMVTSDDDTIGADLTYLDEERRTVLRVVRSGDDAPLFIVDMGGRLFVHDRPVAPLLTQQLIQTQKSITLTLSQMMRNINLAGHRQVDYINAEPPGEWVPSSAGASGAQRFPDGTYKVFTPATIKSGPSVQNFIQGNDIYDQDGKKIGVTNPNVNVVDPVDVAHFKTTYEVFRHSAHLQCHQAHVLMDASGAAISGISREQARADFGTSLGPLKTSMDDAGRWLIEVVLALAAHLMQRPDLFANYRVDFNCVINTGPLSPEEQQEIRENYAAKLISRETAISKLGIDDVQAEIDKIDAERQTANEDEQTNASAILGRAGLLAQSVQVTEGNLNGQQPQTQTA